MFRLQFKRYITVGKVIPKATVFEGSPGTKLDVLSAVKGAKSVIIGVPGAFSPGCSASHVPGYLSNWPKFQDKGFKNLCVVAVNDAFVTNAWKKDLGAPEDVHFIADATGEFTKALDAEFDASAFFGNFRSKRYAILLNEQGVVEKSFVEPDNVSVNVSSAEKVLESI